MRPEQLQFPGFAPPLTDRLFFALFPDNGTAAEACALALRLRETCGLTATPQAKSRLHVSLHHLGDFAGLPPSLVERARTAADALQETAFDIRFDRAGSFASTKRKLPLVLRGGNRVIPLIAFQHALGVALARQGFAPPSPHFTPHMTLLYDTRYVAARDVPPLQWTARELVLVHSLVGRTRHIALGRWPLAPDAR